MPRWVSCVSMTPVLFLSIWGALAQGNSQDKGKGRPQVDFDNFKTPLQSAIEEKVKGKANKPERFEMENMGSQGVVNPAGKMIGKKVKTRTTLRFKNPGQRKDDASKWEEFVLGPSQLNSLSTGLFPDAASAGDRQRSNSFFPDSALNDDKDCLDDVTGQRFGGFLSPSSDQLVPDGDPQSCFDSSGILKRTLHLEADAGGQIIGCRHDSGTFISGDPDDGEEDRCFDEEGNLKTSIQELIDEDGPTGDSDGDGMDNEDPVGDADGDGDPNDDADCIDLQGNILREMDCFDAAGNLLAERGELIDEDDLDEVDEDGDGRFDEDPANGDLDQSCRDFGTQLGLADTDGLFSDGHCDLTRAVMAAVNRKAEQMFQQQGKSNKKIYQVDDEGHPMEGGEGVAYGQEEREVEISETFAVMCEDGLQLDEETGQCVLEEQAEALAQLRRGSYPSSPSDSLEAAASSVTSMDDYVMMGFTFAPPVIEWGYEVKEKACAFGVCVEVFLARVGYEFDVALGLRLPAQLQVSEIPDPDILAESDLTLKAGIQPVNFSVDQYREFCQQHNLDDDPLISDCDRFAFPNFLEKLGPLNVDEVEDGDEFVARLTAFAGLKVRVLGATLINWALDIDMDFAEMCTYLVAKDNAVDLATFSLLRKGDLKAALQDLGLNCGSFTTPFGEETDPQNPLLKRLRTFPFTKGFDVRADCAEAMARQETINVGGRIIPRCTGLILGVSGASLGVGLGVDLAMGSELITAQWSTDGDADPSAGGEVEFTDSADEGEPLPSVGPIRVDNYDDRNFKDEALIIFDDFTYFLNAFRVRLKGQFQFGGILSPIPDLPSFTIYNFVINTGNLGIPIGQHSGTSGVTVPVFVENYGLELDAEPLSQDPELRVDDSTLKIKPGEFGEYLVRVRNIGSFTGDFDNFSYELSNRRDQQQPFTFIINPNTDFDCRDGSGNIFHGDPNDAVPDDCYDAMGNLKAGLTEQSDEDPLGPDGALQDVRDEDGDGVADEDPVDVWATQPTLQEFGTQEIQQVVPYAFSLDPPDSLVLAVSPFRHPLTSPGIYPFRLTADSKEAKQFGLSALDPSGNSRIGASDVAFIEVTAFREPRIAVQPTASEAKPGIGRNYVVEGSNMGNVEDSMSVSVELADFNQGGCTLTTLGKQPDCPFRAVPTAIQEAWTNLPDLATSFGPLQPLGIAVDELSILVPSDWAGMQDTTYQYTVEVISLGDDETPPASNNVDIEQTVIATKESMTRYVALEIEELIAEIEAANAEGISTGGLLPISMIPARMQNQRALDLILDGHLSRASQALSAAQRIMEGFVHALDGGTGDKIPAERAQDWRNRALAIVEDLGIAAESDVPPA